MWEGGNTPLGGKIADRTIWARKGTNRTKGAVSGPLKTPRFCTISGVICTNCTGLQRRHDLIGDLEIRRDFLHVVVVFERLDQLEQLLGAFQVQFGRGGRFPDQLG